MNLLNIAFIDTNTFIFSILSVERSRASLEEEEKNYKDDRIKIKVHKFKKNMNIMIMIYVTEDKIHGSRKISTDKQIIHSPRNEHVVDNLFVLLVLILLFVCQIHWSNKDD